MRKLLFFPAIVFAVASCSPKGSPALVSAVTDLVQDRMKGKVAKVETTTYPIDSTGKKGEMDGKTISVYDDNGYGKSYTKMGAKDSLISVVNMVVNANGFVTKQETVDGKGKKKASLALEVDSAGRYSLVISYDSTGKIDVYYKDIIQNKYMQVTGAKGYHAKDSTLKMAFTNDYDSVFWVSGTTTDSVGKAIYTGKVKLNAKRDDSTLTETNITKGVSKTTDVSYTYDTWDAQGNWTKQTTLNEKGKPTKIALRVITYKP